LHLLRQVRLTGTDGWNWDAPFIHTAKGYAETHDASLIWGDTRLVVISAIAMAINCTTLRRSHRPDFTVCGFPTKVEGASAGWTRAVAIIDG
jgi:kynurenine formamidase